MRAAVDDLGEPLFDAETYLTLTQIKSLITRLSTQVKKQDISEQSTASEILEVLLQVKHPCHITFFDHLFKTLMAACIFNFCRNSMSSSI